jgi:hypothetical protein
MNYLVAVPARLSMLLFSLLFCRTISSFSFPFLFDTALYSIRRKDVPTYFLRFQN